MNIFHFTFMLALLWIAGCSSKPDGDIDRAQWVNAVDAFYTAIENNVEDARFDLYADSVFMLPNFGSYIHGKDRLEKAWRTLLKKSEKNYLFRIKDLNRLDMHVRGDAGYTINDYYYTYHAEGDEPVWKKTKNIHIWRK